MVQTTLTTMWNHQSTAAAETISGLETYSNGEFDVITRNVYIDPLDVPAPSPVCLYTTRQLPFNEIQKCSSKAYLCFALCLCSSLWAG